MTTVKINLEEKELNKLRTIANGECRTIHQQAKYILLHAIKIQLQQQPTATITPNNVSTPNQKEMNYQ